LNNIKKILMSASIIINVLAVFILVGSTVSGASELHKSILTYPVFINGDEVAIEEGYIIDGRTYIQLKEICEKSNMHLEWVDPNPDHNQVLIPGGNLPGGINITNPTFIYSKYVTDFDNNNKLIKCIDITGIFFKYKSSDQRFKYSFSDEGFVVMDNNVVTTIPLDYNPNSGRMYLSVDEFELKLLPYLVQLCEQE